NEADLSCRSGGRDADARGRGGRARAPPPMEAMACRCAVVTTNVGTEDYIVPGETALVVPPRDAEAIADAILTLLDDRRRLQAVAEAGHRHIRTFTWERAVLGVERALQDVVRARR